MTDHVTTYLDSDGPVSTELSLKTLEAAGHLAAVVSPTVVLRRDVVLTEDDSVRALLVHAVSGGDHVKE